MAIVSVGYGTDTVGESEWSEIASMAGAPYSYSTVNALRCYAGSGTRQVMVSDGTTLGYGVRDTLTGESVTLPSSSTTVTWLVCLRRLWGTGNRKTTLAYLQMSGAAPVGRVTQPGVEDYQPLCAATVPAGGTTVTQLVDMRVHAEKARYAPSLQAATLDARIGATYVIAGGDRYNAVLTSAGTVGLEKEKAPPAPVIPSVPIVRAGTATGLVFSSTGAATIQHNLGWDPAVFMCAPRLTASSPLLQVALSTQAGATSTTAAIVTAKIPTNTAAGWKPYSGNLSFVDWIAYGGVQ